MIAEWEPALGALIRWPLGIPMSLVRELAEDDTLYTLVEGASAENQARNTFAANGVHMDHVRFIQTHVYSMWTRDWGPQCVFDGTGAMGITDPWFDGYPWVPGCDPSAAPRNRETRDVRTSDSIEGIQRDLGRGYDEDDAINADVAAALGLPLHQLPAYCTGGNIMTDGHGRAFSTEQMLAENAPHMSGAEFRSRATAYLGITDYRFLADPEVHGIQHIDCYAKLLDEETVLVKDVPAWHPEYDCIEALVDAFAALSTCYGRPYDVVRIWCAPYSGDAVAAYTNSLILNGKVLVPTFGISSDADALQTYQDAMPGYEVIGFDHGSWYYYDALHCRTMGIFDPGMLRITHRTLDDVVPYAPSHTVRAEIADMSGAGLTPGAQNVLWRVLGEADWNEVSMVNTVADSFLGEIPGQIPGEIVEYYLTASDESGRTETLPRTAPDGFFSFRIDPTTSAPASAGGARLAVAPSPFGDGTTLTYWMPSRGHARLAIYDAAGRLVTTLEDGVVRAGRHRARWSGATDSGGRAPSGVYFVRLETAATTLFRKIALIR
jgi:agmatine/peptidylarginine deiminase